MTDNHSPITPDELHAYVDGELPADRQEALTAWLASHPEDAALVTAWRAQADAIRARYGSIAQESVPERLKLEQLTRRGRSFAAMAAAAVIAAFFVGGATGWMAHGASAAQPSGFDRFTAEAIEAYKVYVVEVRHPVEVSANERVHLGQWLSKRLGKQLVIPNLEKVGLKLVGGRLLPGPTGAAAFYMYEGPSGERFTMYCAPSNSPETALRFKDDQHVAAFYWVDKNVAFVVSGPSDRDRLKAISEAIYEQVDKSGDAKG
ncbi:MAG TPA: anti-sigma factor [Pseudolabrys sp.]|nr:anti-sigma factor [Pseudolabrys sp.]